MKIPKAPVAEVCLINLKAPHNLRDPSTFEGAIWATSIATLKKCPGFRDIYTSSFIEDRSKARIFLSMLSFIQRCRFQIVVLCRLLLSLTSCRLGLQRRPLRLLRHSAFPCLPRTITLPLRHPTDTNPRSVHACATSKLVSTCFGSLHGILCARYQ